jgi:hypothetical protein
VSSATKKTLGCARLVGVTMIVSVAGFSAAGGDRPGNETDLCRGNSRPMMYLPYKSDQEADARQLMVDVFDLVLPEKVSEEVLKKAKKGTSKTRADHCY